MDRESRTEAMLENVRGQTSNSVMSEKPDLHDKSKYSQFTRRSLGSHHQRFDSVHYIDGLVWPIHLTHGFEGSMTWGLKVQEEATSR